MPFSFINWTHSRISEADLFWNEPVFYCILQSLPLIGLHADMTGRQVLIEFDFSP
jgi:hypothetical protein